MNLTCCLFCKKRTITCHKDCKEYLEYKRRLEEVKEAKKKLNQMYYRKRCYKYK